MKSAAETVSIPLLLRYLNNVAQGVFSVLAGRLPIGMAFPFVSSVGLGVPYTTSGCIFRLI